MKVPSPALGLALCMMLVVPASTHGAETTSHSKTAVPRQADEEAKEAAGLDLEELANMDVKVTSASKKSESLNQAPAAIYVITGEDVRRGGFSSVPEALRTVPGLYVAQVEAHSWIVAARGFSFAFNNKMLVLLDGRLLYQPLFGGVYWDTIDPLLEDIDRIEVIRGPGGTLWGANAVNGVINIITKSAKDTKGTSISTSAGIHERSQANIRHGGGIGPNFAYRLFGQALYGDATVDSLGMSQANPWNLSHGGIRMDWQVSPKDTFSFDGQGYRGSSASEELNFSGPTAANPVELRQDIPMSGGHLLGRWRHQFSSRSSTDLLAYCDWSDRIDILGGDIRHTCDVEVQHDFRFTPRHSIIWGGSILTTADTPSHTFEISYSPAQRRDNTYSTFGQYEVSLIPDKLRLIGGAKLQHSPYTGFEIQPQIRGIWTPNKSSSLWGAVSRAVRQPAQINTDTDLKVSQTTGGPLPIFAAIVGNPLLRSEVLRAYELGYRYQSKHGYALDISAFYNHYDDLIGTGPPGLPIFFPDYLEIPLPFVNSGPGQTHGLEMSAEVRPMPRWSLSTSLTEMRGVGSAQGTQGVVTPRHFLNVQSRVDLTRHLNLDSGYYYTDALPELGLPTLNRLDIGISTRQSDGFTFSVWGRNLQSAHHLENNSNEPYFPAGEIRRAVVFKLTWQSNPK